MTVKVSWMIIAYDVNHLLRNRMLLETDVLSSLKEGSTEAYSPITLSNNSLKLMSHKHLQFRDGGTQPQVEAGQT